MSLFRNFVFLCGSASGLAALSAGCANVEAPPGSGPDFTPPAVLERYPAPGSVVPDLDDDASIRFDEPIQSPRSLQRGLDLSPAWDWKFSPRTSGFSVRPRDGWQPGVVYHVRIPSGVADLLRNTTRQPIEWTFSTGPEISETRIDGTIYDRVTGSGVQGARILFLPQDSTPYSVVSDTGGVFSMWSLPPGEYFVVGFVDQNRNRRLDPETESYDSTRVLLRDSTSRHALNLWMIPPDSTPPLLVGAIAYDSMTVVLEFDEPLDPEAPLDSVTVLVTPGSGGPTLPAAALQVGQPEGAQLMTGGQASPGRQPPGARPGDRPAGSPDSLPIPDRDELDEPPAAAADSAGAADDSVRAVVPGQDEARGRNEPGQRSLESPEMRERPSPFLTVTLGTPLTADTFTVVVSGVSNLRGLIGGGDTTFVYVAPLPMLAPPNPEAGAVGAPSGKETGAAQAPVLPSSADGRPPSDDEP